MRVSRRWLTTAAATALSVAAWGCSDKPSVDSSTAEAKVTGKVMVYSKPMTSGEVTLDPINYARPNVGTRKGEIKSDGTYEVSALVGKNRVLVTGPEITKNPELRYANYTVDVPSGGTTYDIILPPPNTPKK